MNGKTEILVSLLAKTHAVWSPLRDWHGTFPRNLYFARQRFRLFGVRWASGSGSNADQQQAHRDLEKLAADGLVATAKPRGAKTLFAQLTDAGEAHALALAGLPSIADALDLMREKLVPLHQHPDTMISDWIPEWLICGFNLDSPPTKDEWVEAIVNLETTLMPAFSRGLVESISDVQKTTWLRITERGWGIMDDPPTLPKCKRPAASEEAADLYADAFVSAHEEIRKAKEAANELGFIPISCSPETYRIVNAREARTETTTAATAAR